MEKYRVYSPATPEVSELESGNRRLAGEVAREGIVLLKNNGILPLKEEKAALFGAGARHTIYGGSGSGGMRERYSVNIEMGLKQAGIEITTQHWLDSYDSYYEDQYKTWMASIEREIKKQGIFNFMAPFQVLSEHPFLFPVGNRIRETELTSSEETAIYVIARQAGEGADRRVIKGDFLLDDVEFDNMKLLARHYTHLVVVINCGGQIDLSFLDEVDQIDALLYIGQPGTEGGSAFADVLTGRANPSGRLTDTWAMHYEQFPCYDTYSYCNGNTGEEDYKEGIFVGYRWFDALGIQPIYPFGYGLSYTDFAYKLKAVNQSNGKIKIQADVKNIGGLYSGKEVIQIFIRKPPASISREVRALAAFAKTELLNPGETQTLTMTIDASQLASFYSNENQWKIEPGIYGIDLGNGVNATTVATIHVKEWIVVEKVEPISGIKPMWEDITFDPSKTFNWQTLPSVEIIAADINIIEHPYLLEESYFGQVKTWLKKLTDKEQVALTVGGSLIGRCFNNTPGAVGRTTSELVKKGIANINLCDGPAGLNVFAESVITKNGSQKYLKNIPESYNWGIFKKLRPFLMGKESKGRTCYQYMTAWPAETLQAQTWNTKLIERIGIAVGKEMAAIGTTLWLAPGMNIHRNPLCGRNFEYYSEDPYITGKMAAAITKGVQSQPGVGVTIKHFCCNNQEENREHVSSNVSQRALREIYLKGFEICVREAKPWAVMSSYNRVNGIYVNNSYDLCTKVLRMEWGFQGLVMSDWYATGGDKGDPILCAKAGNDLIMPGNGSAKKDIFRALRTGQIKKIEIEQSAARILQVIANSNVNIE